MNKRVYICNTGGTIGMRRTQNGYAPEAGFLGKQLEEIPELKRAEMPKYELHEFDPLLDSANMRPSNWIGIAKDIQQRYSEFDGFVVTHGTDTMAYTASALSFLLEDLGKPVILTGSQIPLCEVRNDARENLITSLMIAANYDVPEVSLCFGGFLLRGNRARKITANGFDAFQSPNYLPLGMIGTNISIRSNRVRPAAASDSCKLGIEEDQCPQVAAFRLFPGIDYQIMGNLFQPPLQGVVIEAYGVGNAPSNDQDFLNVIKAATDRGVVVVVCTQCNQGVVDLSGYEAGRALEKAGAISGLDLTVEAALAKLYFLLNLDLNSDQIKEKMQQNIAGELTEAGA